MSLDTTQEGPSVEDRWEPLGEAIKLLRSRRRLSQAGLARLMGKAPTSIARMETDQNPTWSSLREACIAMEFDLGDLARAMRVCSGEIPDFDYDESPDALNRAIIESLARDRDYWKAQVEGRRAAS